ncbi:MAG: hypothetical protein UT55_C0027G0005 [Candidatus Peregrinibacteria bacterium GW2011_GWE2_39_6]|nr:MAG: hypothetical protein UT36_C0003G0122 [Candidatus Peregrinibacteria bacterium GW2011_GWF2_39_17]KKR25852.1 MAG: hypothetical protein UT55_C0027G0005 [Candidatus Peregrinibacteria bacterium GW2011_GWE2_39_6]HCW32327.1 hypothetical protein [Candidatus Peregrinibacteria bacterium]
MSFLKRFLPGLIFSLGFLLFAGCGNSINKIVDSVNPAGDDQVEIIGSLNNYIDFMNEAQDQIDGSVTDNLTRYDEGVVAEKEEGDGFIFFMCTYNIFDEVKLTQLVLNPSNSLEDLERNSLIGKAQAFVDILAAIKSDCNDLAKYVSAEDYKDDQFVKSDELTTRMWANIDQYYALHQDLGDYLDTLFEKYEPAVDKGDPTSVALDNMNQVLELADKVTDLVEGYSSLTDFSEVQAGYDQMTTLIADHLGAAQPADLSTILLPTYTSFYNIADTYFMTDLKKTIRDYNSSDLEAVNSDVDSLISSYNSLVDSYNTALDVAETIWSNGL